MLDRPDPILPEPERAPEPFAVPLADNPWWLWELPSEPAPASVPSSEDDER